MLDTINYTQSNGVWTKTVVSVSEVMNIQDEINALKAMIANFELGQESDYSNEVAAAITNYQAQLAILEA